jgi:hypothetical protein
MTDNEFLNTLSASLQRIEGAIFLKEGIMERTTRLEENLKDLLEVSKEQGKSIDNLSDSVSDLKKLMEAHIDNKTQHRFINQVMSSPKTAGFCFGTMLTIYLIAANFPSVFEFFKTLFGF